MKLKINLKAWPEAKDEQKKYFDTKRVKDLYSSKLLLKAVEVKLQSDVSCAAQQLKDENDGRPSTFKDLEKR